MEKLQKPIQEENEKKPISPYGINKLISENKIIEFTKVRTLRLMLLIFLTLWA